MFKRAAVGVFIATLLFAAPATPNRTEKGYADLKLWEDCKAQAKAEGKDVPKALVEMIKDVRKRYEKTA